MDELICQMNNTVARNCFGMTVSWAVLQMRRICMDEAEAAKEETE